MELALVTEKRIDDSETTKIYEHILCELRPNLAYDKTYTKNTNEYNNTESMRNKYNRKAYILLTAPGWGTPGQSILHIMYELCIVCGWACCLLVVCYCLVVCCLLVRALRVGCCLSCVGCCLSFVEAACSGVSCLVIVV